MNILTFGPNGSGKGTQGAIVQKKYNINHIESGAIFREHIKGDTELGKKAKEYIDRGDLVPDDITIPMVLETLSKSKEKGWLLDGFPRSLAQAEALDKALKESGMKLDYVIEIVLDRDIARDFNNVQACRIFPLPAREVEQLSPPPPRGGRARVGGGRVGSAIHPNEAAACIITLPLAPSRQGRGEYLALPSRDGGANNFQQEGP